MKKHPQADELAARLADAANKPVAISPLRSHRAPESEPESRRQPEAPTTLAPQIEKSRHKKRRKTNAGTTEDADDEDTVPISLRPRRDLLIRYVHAASDRMRETGRAISPQQIMLEILDRGP